MLLHATSILLYIHLYMGYGTASNEGDVVVLVSDLGGYIYKFNMTGDNATMISPAIKDSRSSSIDYDPLFRQVYWVRLNTKTIMKSAFDGSNKQSVLITNSTIRDISIDWKIRQMFYVDDDADAIFMMNMSTTAITKIISSKSSDCQPHSIVLDTSRRFIYWTDMETAKIEKMCYNGTRLETLLSTGARWPTGLAIDQQGEHLFWCDAHSSTSHLMSMELATKKVSVIKTMETYFDANYFEGQLYIIARNHRRSFFTMTVNGSRVQKHTLRRRMSEWRRIKVFRYYECDEGYYGVTCESTCGRCAEGSICDPGNGHCPSRCQAGWTGDRCDTECQDGHLDDSCALCTNCRKRVEIKAGGGHCPPGYTGDSCDTSCPEGMYGDGCLSVCGKCGNNAPCDPVSGQCTTDVLACFDGTHSVVKLISGSCVVLAVLCVITLITLWKYKRLAKHQKGKILRRFVKNGGICQTSAESICDVNIIYNPMNTVGVGEPSISITKQLDRNAQDGNDTHTGLFESNCMVAEDKLGVYARF
ncbi:low-density lipoprotein receptor-related protein 6-like [Haliotis rufescens]|uniref:low-density lipoprotein receptor-related protein 6-like n=1 Tax=Haliotis rufescens TaxID=6454 RepID=UPI00201EBBA5|nr:low-density lipoprotein receptor-related protein 6-like [Haliotis rufescens]